MFWLRIVLYWLIGWYFFDICRFILGTAQAIIRFLKQNMRKGFVNWFMSKHWTKSRFWRVNLLPLNLLILFFFQERKKQELKNNEQLWDYNELWLSVWCQFNSSFVICCRFFFCREIRLVPIAFRNNSLEIPNGYCAFDKHRTCLWMNEWTVFYNKFWE